MTPFCLDCAFFDENFDIFYLPCPAESHRIFKGKVHFNKNKTKIQTTIVYLGKHVLIEISFCVHFNYLENCFKIIIIVFIIYTFFFLAFISKYITAENDRASIYLLTIKSSHIIFSSHTDNVLQWRTHIASSLIKYFPYIRNIFYKKVNCINICNVIYI